MKDTLYILIIITLLLCWASTLSSFHQTYREEQLKNQQQELFEYQKVFKLGASGDYKALDKYMKEKYGEVNYCVCVPWSEKMIKKMGQIYTTAQKKYIKVLAETNSNNQLS